MLLKQSGTFFASAVVTSSSSVASSARSACAADSKKRSYRRVTRSRHARIASGPLRWRAPPRDEHESRVPSEAHRFAPEAPSITSVHQNPRTVMLTVGGRLKPKSLETVVDLPVLFGPEKAKYHPDFDLEVGPVDREHRVIAEPVLLYRPPVSIVVLVAWHCHI